jgi:hypothetical protein
VPTLPNNSTFDGDLVNQTFSLSLTSTPIKNLDTKIYYNWYDLDNNSTHVTFDAASAVDCNGPCQNELYSYRKNNAGIEGLYRFDRANRLSGGWDYIDVDQTRIDYDDYTTKPVLGRVQEHLTRERHGARQVLVSGAPQQLPAGRRRHRAERSVLPQPIHQPLRQLAARPERVQGDARLESGPSARHFLRVHLQGQQLQGHDARPYRRPPQRGLRHCVVRRPQQVAGHADGRLRVGEVRLVSPQHQRLGLPGAFDPSTAPNSSNYNWSATNDDNNWMVGVGLDWYVTDKLTIKGSALYFESDGQSDVVSQNNFGNPLPINAYDNWKRTSLNLKAIYALNKSWSFTGGYAYEKTRYSDIAYDGYQYTLPFPGVTNNTGQSYLNGYRAFTNADANIFYLLATYKFDLSPPAPAKVAEPPKVSAVAAAPPPPPPPPPAPPPPPPPAPQVQRITLDSKVLFDFNQAVLRPRAKRRSTARSSAACPGSRNSKSSWSPATPIESARKPTIKSCPSVARTQCATTSSARASPRTRSRRSASAKNNLSCNATEGAQSADRVPATEPSSRGAGQGRIDEVIRPGRAAYVVECSTLRRRTRGGASTIEDVGARHERVDEPTCHAFEYRAGDTVQQRVVEFTVQRKFDLARGGRERAETPVALEAAEGPALHPHRQPLGAPLRVARDDLEIDTVPCNGDSRCDDRVIALEDRCGGAPWQERRIVLGALDQVEHVLGRIRNQRGPMHVHHARSDESWLPGRRACRRVRD